MATGASHYSTLAFAFGLFESDEVPGPLLVQVLGDLGMTESAVRTLFSRLHTAGTLQTRKIGRVAMYSLAGPLSQWFRQIRDYSPGPAWEGVFEAVIYDIPESCRTLRDDLRRTAIRNGYGAPRPGLLIGFEPPDWLDSFHGEQPSLIERARLECETEVARRLAVAAWDIEARSAELRCAAGALEKWLDADEPVPEGAAAIQALRDLWEGHVQILLTTPRLPVEFTPEDWALNRLRSLTLTAGRRYDDALVGYLHDLLRDSPYASLIRCSEPPTALVEKLAAAGDLQPHEVSAKV